MVNIEKIINYSAGTCLSQVIDKQDSTVASTVNRFIQDNDYNPDILIDMDTSSFHGIKAKVADKIREFCVENQIKTDIGELAVQFLVASN